MCVHACLQPNQVGPHGLTVEQDIFDRFIFRCFCFWHDEEHQGMMWLPLYATITLVGMTKRSRA